LERAIGPLDARCRPVLAEAGRLALRSGCMRAPPASRTSPDKDLEPESGFRPTLGMWRDQSDQPGELLDLARGPAQPRRIGLGVVAGAGERGTVDDAVEQAREAGQDRDVDPAERSLELAMIDMAHGAALTIAA
jgi:hypothetical protein